MARHKFPAVAKSEPHQRLVELAKDVLMVALTCSAVFLFTRTTFFADVTWRPQPTPPVPVQTLRPQQAIIPRSLAVRNRQGLYAVAYDDGAVERTFEILSPLLGEGLFTAQTPASITQSQWETLLDCPSIYCEFEGTPSLSLLSAWLGAGSFPSDDGIQALLLAQDGEDIWLSWQIGEQYFSALTTMAAESRFSSLLEAFSPNGAAFAYTLAQSDSAYCTLDPYVLIPMTTPRPRVFTMTAPDFTADDAALERLQIVLDLEAGSTYTAADGWLAINDESDRLRVSRDGSLVYHARETGRYAVPGSGEIATAPEAAQAAWELLNRMTEWTGEGQFVLTACEDLSNGWRISFQYRLDGIGVLTGEEGWCAQFTVKGCQISDFTLRLCTFSPTSETTSLPPERLAAAALSSLPDAGSQLILCYSGVEAGLVTASWTVRM